MYGIKDGLDYFEELYRFSCQKGQIQIYITGKKVEQVGEINMVSNASNTVR
jgi:hypothetical protein